LAEKFKEVNLQAVELAKEAVGEQDVLIAASIGPLGQMLQPFGTLTMESAQLQFRNQAQEFSNAGADLLLVETQYDLNETLAALMGIREASDLPLICSFSFDRGLRSMMGVSPKQFAEAMRRFNLSAIGINCGKNLEDNLNALKELKESTDLPIWFKPNAGMPKVNAAGMPSYDLTPEAMAAQVPAWIEAGARIIGGCCGTSPQHLAAIAAQVKKLR
jgi:5-methyltetrahydrofolate--homocysteine methyltransferase